MQERYQCAFVFAFATNDVRFCIYRNTTNFDASEYSYGLKELTASISVGRTEEDEVAMIIESDATLADAVRQHIILTLASCGGNRTHAAKILDISLRGLRDKLRGYVTAGVKVTPAQRLRSHEQADPSLRRPSTAAF
jgi:DNA-binding NtrC family response regulator